MVNQCIIINIHQKSFLEPWQYCDTFTEKKTQFQMPLQQKKLSLIWRNQMKSMKTRQLTSNPYHPKTGERQQQVQSFASTLKNSKIYLT